MKGHKSIKLSRTAIFSAVLTIAEFMAYNFTWPVLPPIVVVPFITSFILALSIPFAENQWVMGLVASLIVNISKGGILPGPFIIPIYGFIFQTRRVKLSGALSSIIHFFYGVFLAPLLFAVAPAKIVFKWILIYTDSFAVAIIVAVVIFGIVGAIAASLGHRIGLKIAKNLHRGRYDS